MAWNDSAPLPFEPPEQENIRLREGNARLQRLLAVHGITISQTAPEKDRRCSMADREAQGQHSGRGSPAAATQTLRFEHSLSGLDAGL